MYKNIEAINKEVHKNSAVKEITNIEFAKDVSSAVVTLGEFYSACKDYPVVFTKDKEGSWSAIAILGIKDGENLFVKDGKWDIRSYIPAFFRRYPFIFAKQNDGNLVLAVENEYIENEAKDEKRKLFTNEGENSEFLNSIMLFLNDYQKDAMVTTNFIKHLDEMELLEEKNIQATDAKGEKFTINGFFAVNEEKLQHLGKKKKEKICNEGLSPFITAHLISLGCIQKLIAMR